MGWNFWIDRGGTFTDLVGISPLGEQVVRKVLSEQPNQLGDPAINLIREILDLKDCTKYLDKYPINKILHHVNKTI